MFKYQVGDRVLVKKRLSTSHPYPMDNNHSHPGYCVSDMFHKPLCGCVVTIKACYCEDNGEPGWYEILEEQGVGWTDGMFLKKVKA